VRRYEYIRLAIDIGDLLELNGLSSVGFRVLAVVDEREGSDIVHYALLERELPNMRVHNES
jgi:hypothetical protein